VQHELGEITPEAMSEVAGILKVAPSEVEAVSTFYSMYFQHPHGRHEVIVCINVSCALRGAEEIVDHLETSLGCASGETTADGEFTWSSTVECLGGCGGAPTMQVDHHFVENLTPERVDAVLGGLRGGPTRGSGHNAGPVIAGTPPRRTPRGAPARPPATPPAAHLEPSVGPTTAPPIVASPDQAPIAKRSAQKSTPQVSPKPAKPATHVPSEGAPDSSSEAASSLATPKEPDPAATMEARAKGRGRRPRKGAQ
jgi:NADH-quinone oxidoreductase subunit E